MRIAFVFVLFLELLTGAPCLHASLRYSWPADVVQVPSSLPNWGASLDEARQRRGSRFDGWVIDRGTVDRILRDDTKRPRHQRFVVRMDEGSTVLIAHNIDLAPRVPFRRGDRIAFRGRYEWNAQGGLVHWTHRGWRSKTDGGWIVWKGQTFR